MLMVHLKKKQFVNSIQSFPGHRNIVTIVFFVTSHCVDAPSDVLMSYFKGVI